MIKQLKYIKNMLPYGPKYKVGMYGGKFLPMHKGHVHCINEALTVCEKLYVILFVGGFGEKLVRKTDDRFMLTRNFRQDQLYRISSSSDRIEPLVIDISDCINENGDEDWDAETPLVLDACQERFDVVFGSEPTAYAPYFKRAYPWADYVIIDADRKTVPISATKIRAMSKEEAATWIV